MGKFLRYSAAAALLLLLGFSTLVAQEPVFSAGPSTGAFNQQGLGFSWGDLNNDGYLDLFCNADNLSVNNRGVSFTRQSSSYGIVPNILNIGSLFADFNGDGYPELLYTVGSAVPSLLKNNAGTSLTPFTPLGGLATVGNGAPGQIWGVAAGDYNGDGYVDIVWAGATATGSPAAGWPANLPGTVMLFKGSAAGFVSVGSRSASPVIDTTKQFETWNPVFVDVNNDGRPDLWLPSFRNGLAVNNPTANTGGSRSVLYLNKGDGTFAPPTKAATGYTGIVDTGLVVNDTVRHISAIASAWGDFDNDGIMDLAVLALNNDPIAGYIKLFKGKGDGTFTDVSAITGITYDGSARGLAWGDYNNDGYLDLLVARGFSGTVGLWRNNGDGTFTNVQSIVGLPGSGLNSRSGMLVDYDNDGFLDLYVVAGSPAFDALWHNGGNLNNWVAFKAIAAGMNGSGIGTRFTVYTKNGSFKQIRNIEAGGNGGACGGNIVANFGIGTATAVDSVVAWWPDGTKQTFTGLAINRYWTIKEGSAIPAATTLATPADAATGLTSPITLTWNAATNATGYRVQVSLDQAFADARMLAVNDTAASTSKSVRVGTASTYYWRVAATNGGFISSYSSARSFSTGGSAATLVPVPLVPRPDSSNAPAVITLKWSRTSDAAQYHYQVSSLSNFSSFAVDDVTADTTKTLTLVQARKYYWKVRGENGLGQSAFSGVDSFTVKTAPSVPALVSPATGVLNVIVDSVLVVWHPVALVDAYTLELSWAAGPTNTVRTYTITAPDTTYMLRSLARNTTYFWRVLAYNIGGTSLFSGANNFTTVPAVPPVPSPTLPASTATGVSRLTTFTWGASTNASKYRLQVATDNAFASVVRDTTVYEITAVTLANPLSASTDYYWRVSSANVGGVSAYSTARLFTTGLLLAVDNVAEIPKVYDLSQNYPNPFNPSTKISYDLPKTSQVKIVIYDVLGREVTTLVDGIQAASKYTVNWNASNLSTGVYFYRMTARSVDGSGDFTSVKKLLLMK